MFKFFIISAVLLLKTFSFISAADEKILAKAPSRIVGNLDSVKATILGCKAGEKKIALVMGAVPSEAEKFSFDESFCVIYLDENPVQWEQWFSANQENRNKLFDTHNASCKDNLLLLDFNDIPALQELAMTLPGSFDVIISDYGTDHFMKFTPEHLNKFLTLLSPEGKMFFRYDSNVSNFTISNNQPDPNDPNLFLYQLTSGLTPTIAYYKDYDVYVCEWAKKHLPGGQLVEQSGKIPFIKANNVTGRYLELSHGDGTIPCPVRTVQYERFPQDFAKVIDMGDKRVQELHTIKESKVAVVSNLLSQLLYDPYDVHQIFYSADNRPYPPERWAALKAFIFSTLPPGELISISLKHQSSFGNLEKHRADPKEFVLYIDENYPEQSLAVLKAFQKDGVSYIGRIDFASIQKDEVRVKTFTKFITENASLLAPNAIVGGNI